MHCKILKLTNGEDIMAMTNGDWSAGELDFIEVVDPVSIVSVRMPYKGTLVESYIMQPWLKMAKDEPVKIRIRNIITVTNVVEKAEAQYKFFIEKYNSTPDQGFADGDMPTEEDVLDEYFNDMDSLEDDDDDASPDTTRIYH